MDTLLYAALSNAAVIAVLAPIVAVFGRVSRRPALVHSLWLLVLLKLFTPPLWPVSLSWPVSNQTGPGTSDATGLEPRPAGESVDTVLRNPLPKETVDDIPEESAATSVTTAAALDATSPLPEGPAPPTVPEPLEPSHPAVPAASFSWQAWLGTIWLAGSGLWLALAVYRIDRFRRLLHLTWRAPQSVQLRARRLAERMGLTACPDVWIVPAPISPLLWALAGAPRLLVPESLLERLTEEQWDTLLAHELAHLRRGDPWVRLLELASLGVYWWHPVVWWARRELREVEEQCCDAWVVWALPGAAEVYASALVEAVSYLSGARSALPLAASGIGHLHLLKRRLTMIMRGTTPRALSTAGSLTVLGVAAVLLPLYPSWAQTGARPEGVGVQQTPGDTATTTGRAGGDTVTTSGPSADGQEDPAPGAPAGRFFGGGGTAQHPGGFEARRGTTETRAYPETVEDAQDEIDLLSVQLDLRRAERREVQARVRQAQTDRERVSRLVATHSVDRSEAERANTEVEAQEARLAAKDVQIKEAELRLKQAQRRLAKLRGQAPSSGGGVMGGRGAGRGPAGGPFGATGSGRFGSSSPPGGPVDTERGGGAPTGPSSGTAPRGGFFGGGSGFGGFAGGTPGVGGQSGGFGGPPGPGGGPGFPGGETTSPRFAGGDRGVGRAPTLEHRLREVEKKLDSLIEELKTLRKEQPTEKSPPRKD